MERNRVILTDRDRQQQQEHERQENNCSDPEAAVNKHFDESLRLAKGKVSHLKCPHFVIALILSKRKWREKNQHIHRTVFLFSSSI